MNNNSEIYINCQHRRLEIYLPNHIEYPLNIAIFNVNGQFVMEKTFHHVEHNTLMIDLKEFSFGIYIIRLSNENESFSEKFILL